jgi:hypothetical protein
MTSQVGAQGQTAHAVADEDQLARSRCRQHLVDPSRDTVRIGIDVREHRLQAVRRHGPAGGIEPRPQPEPEAPIALVTMYQQHRQAPGGGLSQAIRTQPEGLEGLDDGKQQDHCRAFLEHHAQGPDRADAQFWRNLAVSLSHQGKGQPDHEQAQAKEASQGKAGCLWQRPAGAGCQPMAKHRVSQQFAEQEPAELACRHRRVGSSANQEFRQGARTGRRRAD